MKGTAGYLVRSQWCQLGGLMERSPVLVMEVAREVLVLLSAWGQGIKLFCRVGNCQASLGIKQK